LNQVGDAGDLAELGETVVRVLLGLQEERLHEYGQQRDGQDALELLLGLEEHHEDAGHLGEDEAPACVEQLLPHLNRERVLLVVVDLDLVEQRTQDGQGAVEHEQHEEVDDAEHQHLGNEQVVHLLLVLDALGQRQLGSEAFT